MTESKFLKCTCAQCGGHIEFPADGIGQTVTCPHCQWPTELALDTPEETSAAPRRSLKWTIAGIVILGVGVAGDVSALLLAQKLLRKPRAVRSNTGLASQTAGAGAGATAAVRALPTKLISGFSVSDVKIVKTPNTTLVYASGTIRNETDRQRFGVTLEIDLFDESGGRIGSTKDYNRDAIEPHGSWTFRALLVQKGVASARVSSIREQE